MVSLPVYQTKMAPESKQSSKIQTKKRGYPRSRASYQNTNTPSNPALPYTGHTLTLPPPATSLTS